MECIFFGKVLKILYWLYYIFARAYCITGPLQNLKFIILFPQANFWGAFSCILHQSRAMSRENTEVLRISSLGRGHSTLGSHSSHSLRKPQSRLLPQGLFKTMPIDYIRNWYSYLLHGSSPIPPRVTQECCYLFIKPEFIISV